jgi:hypothetical protein
MFSPVSAESARWNVGAVSRGDKLGVLKMFPDFT